MDGKPEEVDDPYSIPNLYFEQATRREILITNLSAPIKFSNVSVIMQLYLKFI
jgi:hypothetical protein